MDLGAGVDLSEGQTHLDSHADTCLCGSNFIMLEREDQVMECADVNVILMTLGLVMVEFVLVRNKFKVMGTPDILSVYQTEIKYSKTTQTKEIEPLEVKA